MLSTPRRARARGVRGSAVVAAAALVVTLVPALLVSTSSNAAGAPAAAPAAPADQSVWSASGARVQASSDGHKRRVNPSAYKAYTLDAGALDDIVSAAPDEASKGAPATLQLPAPTGELVTFNVVESSIMESGLAAAHPEIKTYAGRSADGRATVRFDVTPMGFHAFVRGARGGDAWFIDPAYNGDDSLYLSYMGDSLPAPERGLAEPDLDEVTGEEGLTEEITPKAGEAPGDPVKLRTYRLALVTDPAYAQYFGTANVLAEKVTLINRVNEVYNDDLAIRLVLINESDKLNLDTAAKATGTNGPCGAAACFSTSNLASCTSLGPIRIALGQLIGAENYDIGHLGLGVPGGGVASLGVVGGNSKAQGCTGLPQPEGDFYAIDYVAHEMGHQFSGNHTFNGNQWNCESSNRNAGTSVEPGSGSSVMAYAGICQQDNIQPHSDPYFSQRSQTEISTYVTSDRAPINDVQTVSLYGFDGSDAITLTFKGETTAPIPAGSTSAQIDTALESLPSIGTNGVAVSGYANQNTVAGLTNGIQITFNGSTTAMSNPSVVQTAGIDQPVITVNPVAGDVTGFVGTTAQGGPIQNGGSTVVTSANHAPSVTVPATKTIPLRTPFTLTGSGSDADNDSLVYLWEQNDRGASGGSGGTALVSNVKANGALFRVFGQYANVTPAGTLVIHSPGENLADGNPSRTFPDMDQILANNTNADSGTCPAAPAPPASGGATNVPVQTVECYAEFLPTTDYVGTAPANNTEPSLNFRFTARDLDPTAGGYAFGDTKLLLDPGTGPFLVTSKNTGTPAAAVAGRSEAILWNVANTNGYTDSGSVVHAPLAENVKISMSIDGGQSFPYVLAESTPNDGSQVITWPNAYSDYARIKVEAVDNYFFDVNNAYFSLVPGFLTTGPSASSYSMDYTDGPSSPISVSANTGRGNSSILTGSATGLPAGLTLTKTDASAADVLPGTANFTVTGAVTDAPGSYPVTVTVGDGTDSEEFEFTITVTTEDATATYTGPPTAEAPVGGNDVVTIPLSAHVTQAADGSTGDVSKATVTFKDTTANEVLCADVPVNASGDATCSYAVDTPLNSGRTYAIELTVGGRFTGTGTGALVVSLDGTAPDTTIVSGPAQGSLVVGTSATFALGSSESPSTFTCTLDGDPVPCAGGTANLVNLDEGVHTFTATAKDAGGNTDATPVSRTFGTPIDDESMTVVKGPWQHQDRAGAYLGSVSVAKKSKARLGYLVTDARSIAVLVERTKKSGKLQVFLNGTKIQTIDLKGSGAATVTVASFGSPTTGFLELVAKTKKHKKQVVTVDGIGILP